MKASKQSEGMSIQDILDKKTMDVVAEVYYLMETKGIKQKAIAEAVGWEESYLSQVLTGFRKNLTLKTIAKLEKALNTEVLVAPVKYRRELRRDIEQLKLFIAAIPEDIKKKLHNEFVELATDQMKPKIQKLVEEPFEETTFAKYDFSRATTGATTVVKKNLI